ncbi:MFS general substrate transporter [Hymenopellis radicata]|nr:MFS general substrate transporter [Hymenopellis radicata]
MAGADIHLTDRVSGAEVMELDTISRKSVNITEEARPVEDVESRIESPPSGYRIRSIAQFTACCWLKMLSGWNDGTSGPLIPRLQEVYQINFIVVSLIFVMACVGFLAGAFMNVPLTDKFGFGKVVFFASFCQVVVYALQSAALPFPAYAALFVLNGVGLSLQDAQAVTYVASLKDHPEMKMMLLQASYGAGAFASPLVATQFATMEHWSFHYLVSLGLALINTAMLGFIFKWRDLDACLERVGLPAGERGSNEHGKIKQILGLKTVHLLAAFTMVYVGAEVTIGGWIVTFIQTVRGGGASSGYISSGFFGGLMAGRLVLLWVNQKLGDRIAMFLYTAIAMGEQLELIVWFVPSLIGGAVASHSWLRLGPMYPILMSYAGRVLPRWLLAGCIGWIASLGQTGSAVLPFITGAVATRRESQLCNPCEVVGMLVSMLGLWALVPNIPRRVD